MNKVTLHYDPTWRALDWAKKHCNSYITNAGGKRTNRGFTTIDYYFGDQRDATMFALRWAQCMT